MRNVQTIKTPTGDDMVVLPKADYDRLMAAARGKLEDEVDIREASRVLARLERGKEPTFPHDVVKRLGREHPIQVLREHRGMTQRALAEAAGMNQLYLSQLETGRATGGLGKLTKLAKVLGVSLDLITAAAEQLRARQRAGQSSKRARKRA
jgi:ribosome-binding protein aMBF1 (putative translation factor)